MPIPEIAVKQLSSQERGLESCHQPSRDTHVDEHTYNVVGDGDEWACGKGRVNLESLEHERDEGAEHRGKHHNAEE